MILSRKVSKNTLVMYVRMILLMIIGFYTSRLLLLALGVEDYGIYSIVGSVATTFVALKSLFSESVQRFINYEKGKKSLSGQKEVFSIAIIIHIILAFSFVIIAELIGLWLISNKLEVPIAKFDDAVFVFHMTVVASFIYILTIPFESVIIANERFATFAFLSVFDGIYRLIILLIFPTGDNSFLKVYSMALVFPPLLTMIFFIFYCRRFDECRIVRIYTKSKFKDIISLSLWNFIGNISFSLIHEGINFIMNIFGGLVFNAARAVAYQVRGVTLQMSSNLMVAARPMIMQSAASDEDQDLFANIRELSRLSFFIMLLTIIPVITICRPLLYIWLMNVPEYSEIFTILVLLGILVRSLHEPLNIMYMSFVRIKRMMCIEMFVMLVGILIIYFTISIGFPMWSAFVILLLVEVSIVLSLMINAWHEINFPIKLYINEVIFPMTILFTSSIIFSFFLQGILNMSNVFSVLLSASLSLSFCFIAIYCVLNYKEKHIVKYILNRIRIKVVNVI